MQAIEIALQEKQLRRELGEPLLYKRALGQRDGAIELERQEVARRPRRGGRYRLQRCDSQAARGAQPGGRRFRRASPSAALHRF
jgi:hypothetical protein